MRAVIRGRNHRPRLIVSHNDRCHAGVNYPLKGICHSKSARFVNLFFVLRLIIESKYICVCLYVYVCEYKEVILLICCNFSNYQFISALAFWFLASIIIFESFSQRTKKIFFYLKGNKYLINALTNLLTHHWWKTLIKRSIFNCNEHR